MKNLVLCIAVFLLSFMFGNDSTPKSITASKNWPEQPLKGLNIGLVAYEKNNPEKKLFPDASTFEQLKKWNVNVVRCIIKTDIDSLWKGRNREAFPGLTNANFIAFYKDHLRGLDSVIKYSSKNNISVILSAGDIIGRKKGGAQFELYFTKLWEFIAKHYNNTKSIIAYDVLNEPNTSFENSVLTKNNYGVINAIRQYDKETYIMIEPFPWGFAESFKNLNLINDAKIIYSIHFYEPHSYTHQGIKSYSDYKKLS
jgi:endoglucanase